MPRRGRPRAATAVAEETVAVVPEPVDVDDEPIQIEKVQTEATVETQPVSDPDEFEVESIIDKRIDEHGTIRYLVKWKNYDESANTWEPPENLSCAELINEFEDKLKRGELRVKGLLQSPPAFSRKRPHEGDALHGFDRGLQAERIIGATDSTGELMFLMKWKDTDEADLVPAKQANIRCPQVVIQFYEERLTWHATEDE